MRWFSFTEADMRLDKLVHVLVIGSAALGWAHLAAERKRGASNVLERRSG